MAISENRESLIVETAPGRLPHQPRKLQAARGTRSPAFAHANRWIASLGGAGFGAGILFTLQQERLQTPLVALSVAGLLLLAWGLRQGGRRFIVLAGVVLALVLAYSWSLDQTVRITIHVTPRGLTADIGGDVRHIAFPKTMTANGAHVGQRHKKGRTVARRPFSIGLYMGQHSESIVQPTGVLDVNHIAPRPVASLATHLRYLTPGVAWSDLTITYPSSNGLQVSAPARLHVVSGTWHHNVRGEVTGSPGAITLLRRRPGAHTYTLSADLSRPDGLVGILVGRHLPSYGYIFVIRLDLRMAWWAGWKAPTFGRWTVQRHAISFPLNDLAGEIQYLLRNLLPAILISLALILLVLVILPLSQILTLLVRALGRVLRLRLPTWRMPSLDRISILPALVIGGGAAGVMAWLSGYDYQHLPSTQDTVVDLFQAKTLALGRLWAPIPGHYWFFHQYAMLTTNHHWFGKYPPGWAMTLTPGVLFNVPWLVNPIVSGIGVFLVFLVGREMFGWKVGLVAETLAFSSPFILFLGAGFYAEPVTWLYLGLYAFLLLRWRRMVRERGRQTMPSRLLLLAAGLAIGMAAISRPLDAVVFGAPFLLLMWRRPLSVPWLAPTAAIPVALYVAYSVILTGNWVPNGHALADKWDRVGFGPGVGGPGHSFYSHFTPNQSFANLAAELEYFHIGALGWPFFLAIAMATVPFILGRAGFYDWLLATAGFCIVAAYWFYWGTAIIQSSFPRYWYLTVPCLALLCARGFQELYRLPLRLRAFRPNVFAAALAPGVLLAGLLWFSVTTYSPSLASQINGWNYDNAAPLTAVSRARLHHAIVFQVQNTNNWWPFGCVFDANSPLLNTNVIYAQDRGWWDWEMMEQYPTRSYYRLNGTRLTRIYLSSVGRKFRPQLQSHQHQECGTVFYPSTPKHRSSQTKLGGSRLAVRRGQGH